MTRVAIQGEAGSFSHAAALALFGPDTPIVTSVSFEDLFRTVERNDADRGLVPIENTLAGSVHENYDLLSSHALHVVGETELRIRHCLVARPGATLENVVRVASHPVALAQCRRFFVEHPALVAVPAYDTAGSVRDLMAGTLAADAAIASALAARLYGAAILAEGLEDHAENYTRFLVIGREAVSVEGSSKISLMFTTPNVPGALHRVLGIFAARDLNLTKIESRPIPGRPWEYLFYLDFAGDAPDEARTAVEELRAFAPMVRVLGMYPDRALSRAGNGTGASP
jgi:prephenate dehydratase